ncbi:Rieske 2Fe-2S domain-containing protein [Ramlibacter terrae]|uniref:Rieske 2Fe-2S domain-containing protein n=1 Tax=Ramlibacter terrae TaxID=2732511 RepID=A0ABX6P5I8_9BURK|nr:Rieske 2Fe-2S domain-containing protein [Ramlibacter terrae]
MCWQGGCGEQWFREGCLVCHCLERDAPGRGTIARTVPGEPLVAFRGDDGVAAVVADRCPHRGVPLSLGKVAGPTLQCPYHGLRFNGAGACVHNPHVKGDPGRLAVRSYPVVERFGAVWVWTGDAALADAAKVPDYSWFDAGRPGYRTVRGQLHVQAGFRLVIDNLLDLSHAEYLHAGTVGTPGSSGSLKASVDVGRTVSPCCERCSTCRRRRCSSRCGTRRSASTSTPT